MNAYPLGVANAMQRQQLLSNERPALTYFTMKGDPPTADFAEPLASVDEAVKAVMDQLPGWRVASHDYQLADALIAAGCRLVRQSHLFSLNLRESHRALNEVESRLFDRFATLDFVPASQAEPDALVDVSLAAYPVGHPDAETQDRGEVRSDIEKLLSGGAIGPLISGASELALEQQVDDVRPVGLVVINQMPGVAPTGGPWVSEVCRAPQPQYSGMGSVLLVRAIRWLRERGHTTLSLAVTEGNPARATYERLGFAFVLTSWKVQVPVAGASVPTS